MVSSKWTHRLTATLVAMLMLGCSARIWAVELKVYAGAGLRPAIDALVQEYQRQSGDQVRVEYGGSGAILTRYQLSHQGDVFIPGSRMYFDKLAGEVLSVHDIVAHTPVIGVSLRRGANVQRLDDLTQPGLRVALGDPKAMALGRTAEHILNASGQGDAIRRNTVMRAGTVKQLAMYLVQGEVDAAIIGRTEAFLNAGHIRMVAIPEHLYQPEIVAAGVLKSSQHPDQAQALVDFLTSTEGVAGFEKVGFLPIQSTWQASQAATK